MRRRKKQTMRTMVRVPRVAASTARETNRQRRVKTWSTPMRLIEEKWTQWHSMAVNEIVKVKH